MTGRPDWPICPRPLPGEVFSSWIDRVARIYQLTATQLLQGYTNKRLISNDIERLDLHLPEELLEPLAVAARLSPERIRQTTLGHFVWPLARSLEGQPSCSYDQYIRDHRFLFWSDENLTVPMVPQVPWLMKNNNYALECPLCRQSDPIPYQRLAWSFCLVDSCPIHGYELVVAGLPLNDRVPERATDVITLQVISEGRAKLPSGRIVRGRWWFRYLRAVIHDIEHCRMFLEEDEAPSPLCGPLWKACGVRFPKVPEPYNYFELADRGRRLEIMRLVNGVVDQYLLKPRGPPLRLWNVQSPKRMM